MTSAVSVFGHKSEFDSFLFAPVGEERNGMLLSVLSALARLDVDPWQEAATLTKMPAQDATLRLASLLSSLPSDAATVVAPSTVIRLISLLPRVPLQDRRPRERSISVMARYWMIAFYFLMTFVLMFAERFAEDRPTPASTKGTGSFRRNGAVAEDGTQSRRGSCDNPNSNRSRTRPARRTDSAGERVRSEWLLAKLSVVV